VREGRDHLPELNRAIELAAGVNDFIQIHVFPFCPRLNHGRLAQYTASRSLHDSRSARGSRGGPC
jgi:hypothetical protein